MTNTPATSALPPPAAAPRALGRFLGRTSLTGTSTPARLRAWQATTIVVALLLAVLGGIWVGRRQQAIDDVRAAAAQLIDVQDIRVSVVQADAIASSSYLAGGQEDPVQRAAYLAAIDNANALLVSVAGGASDADADRLAEANALLGVYVGLVEQARANNRQGFPVGAAYQRQANAVVANDDASTPDVVATLRAVEDSARAEVNERLDAAHRAGAVMLLGSLAVLVLVVLGSWWMFRRFRRVLNVPLAMTAVLALGLLLVGGARQAGAVGDADDAVSGPLHTADLAAQARAAGFDARAQEAFTLINRGNGQANETRWRQASDTVVIALSECGDECRTAQEAFSEYSAAHADLRAADDAGNWDEAVDISLGLEGDLVVHFDEFAADSATIIERNAAAADDGLAGAAAPLGPLRAITIVAGLLFAVLVAVGYGQRLKEYR